MNVHKTLNSKVLQCALYFKKRNDYNYKYVKNGGHLGFKVIMTQDEKDIKNKCSDKLIIPVQQNIEFFFYLLLMQP